MHVGNSGAEHRLPLPHRTPPGTLLVCPSLAHALTGNDLLTNTLIYGDTTVACMRGVILVARVREIGGEGEEESVTWPPGGHGASCCHVLT